MSISIWPFYLVLARRDCLRLVAYRRLGWLPPESPRSAADFMWCHATTGPPGRKTPSERRRTLLRVSPGQQPFHADVLVQVRPMNVLVVRVKLPSCSRAPAVACTSLGYQTSGPVIQRPSARWIVNSLLVILTLVAPGTSRHGCSSGLRCSWQVRTCSSAAAPNGRLCQAQIIHRLQSCSAS